jgi:hypothetical protein
MIYWKSLKLSLLAITTALSFSIASSPNVQAQDSETSGISFGSIKFGKAPNTKWLAVKPERSTTRNFFASRRSAGSFSSSFGTQIAGNFDRKLLAASRIAVNNARRHSTRSCWRYVKSALLKAEVVDSYPRTTYAKQAGRELENDFGFVKTGIRTPESAPIGSVLVYGGRGAGHVEIRAAEGYVSDFVSPKPSPRPLIGVYVKR